MKLGDNCLELDLVFDLGFRIFHGAKVYVAGVKNSGNFPDNHTEEFCRSWISNAAAPSRLTAEIKNRCQLVSLKRVALSELGKPTDDMHSLLDDLREHGLIDVL